MRYFVLHLEYLIHLHLLHLSNLSCNFTVGFLVLTGRRVGEYLVKLHHGLLECLQLGILCLNLHEQVVELLDKIVDSGVEVREACVLRVQDSISGVLLLVELRVDVVKRLQAGKVGKCLILMKLGDVLVGGRIISAQTLSECIAY